jgi:hypothetical protein
MGNLQNTYVSGGGALLESCANPYHVYTGAWSVYVDDVEVGGTWSADSNGWPGTSTAKFTFHPTTPTLGSAIRLVQTQALDDLNGTPATDLNQILVREAIYEGPGPALIYHAYNWSGDASSCAISNVLSEIDNVTTFGPGGADKLTRNPARIYSGCFFEYSGGNVYIVNGTTAGNFRPREARSSDMNCMSAAAATILANAYLARCATEEDRITVNLERVPAPSVNLMRPGQRIPVKLTHAPDYESGAYMGIMRRTVTANAYGLYNVQLELSHPVLTGFNPTASGLTPSLWTLNIGAVVAPAPPGGTGGLPGQRVPLTYIRDGDGVSTLVTLGSAYLPGSVLIEVDGLPVEATSITETSPSAGTVTLDFAPAGALGGVAAQAIAASWQVA